MYVLHKPPMTRTEGRLLHAIRHCKRRRQCCAHPFGLHYPTDTPPRPAPRCPSGPGCPGHGRRRPGRGVTRRPLSDRAEHSTGTAACRAGGAAPTCTNAPPPLRRRPAWGRRGRAARMRRWRESGIWRCRALGGQRGEAEMWCNFS